jgi:hypothetical protein
MAVAVLVERQHVTEHPLTSVFVGLVPQADWSFLSSMDRS